MAAIPHIDHNRIHEPLWRVLRHLATTTRATGRPIWAKEVYDWSGITRQGTKKQLNSLAERELIRYIGPKADVVEVTEWGFSAAATGRVPKPLALHEGGAHAGTRGSEVEAETTWVRCIADLFRIESWDADYFLPVVGDCMAGMRGGRVPIFPGAVVLFHRASRWQRPANGRLAHVEVAIGDSGMTEALLRDYAFDEATQLVTLMPRNPSYAPLVLHDEIVDVRGWSDEWKQPDFIDERARDLFLSDVRDTANLYLPMKRDRELELSR